MSAAVGDVRTLGIRLNERGSKMEHKSFLAYESMDVTTPRDGFDTELDAIMYALTPKGDWVIKIIDTRTNATVYTMTQPIRID